MTFSIINNAALLALALGMFCTGKFGRTRQMGLAPLLMAAMDGAYITQIRPAATPVLSAILIALQITVLIAGIVVLYEDRVRAKNKADRRRRRREIVRSRAAFERASEGRSQLQICA